MRKQTEEFYGFENALLEFLVQEVGPENYWFKAEPEDGGINVSLRVWGKQFEESDSEE